MHQNDVTEKIGADSITVFNWEANAANPEVSEADASAFEEHLLICARCRAAVEDANQYVKGMREAAQRVRAEQEPRREKP